MTEWLINIVGVVFIGVLIEVIAPSGKLNKFIKSIFGVFVIFVIAQPMLLLLSGSKEINLDYDLDNNLSEDYISNFNFSRLSTYQMLIENKLEKEGIKGVRVTISGNIYNSELSIDKVMCDISKLVLSEDKKHIDKYDNITNVILEVINVDKGMIEFYE